MPRIDPLKLLTCLSVLLAPNGGIKSTQEVKRLASLMTKFSKKLVSKCIYIQILKCTETELLGQFMTAGGWSLTHMWLTDGILTKNWSLVQELLELLLLCPVDVTRLKSNSAPKLVKGLSKESSHEGVRLLATKLVEQWLKIVKEEGTGVSTVVVATTDTSAESSTPAVMVINSVPNILKKTPIAIKPIVMQPEVDNDEEDEEEEEEEEDDEEETVETPLHQNKGIVVEENQDSDELDNEILIKNQKRRKAALQRSNSNASSDSKLIKKQKPVAAVAPTNNTEKLVYKFTVKDGKKVVVAKVNPMPVSVKKATAASETTKQNKQIIIVDSQQLQKNQKLVDNSTRRASSSSDKEQSVPKLKLMKKNNQFDELKDSALEPSSDSSSINSSSCNNVNSNKKEKSISSDQEKTAVDKEKSTSSGKLKEKEKLNSSKDVDKSKERDRKSSSNHKSSSSSKTSSSKHSSSISGHKSSSGRSGSSDKDRSRDKDRKSSSSSSRDKTKESEKRKSASSKEDSKVDKSATSSLTDQKIADSESMSKLGKIPKKPSSKDDAPSSPSEDGRSDKKKDKPIKKPSMSIEVRQGDKPKTVKTLNSQFRSHGLTEEAPPPPARKGLKKPSSAPTPGATIAVTVTPKLTTPDKEHDSPPEKKLKEEIVANTTVEKPGAIKLIKAKPQLMESDMFMSAISAATNKKDIRKRKRQLSKDESIATAVSTSKGSSGKKSPTQDTPTTPTSPKVVAAPLKFYQDTLETADSDTSKTGADDSIASEDKDDEKTDVKKEESGDDKAEGDEKKEGDDDPAIDIKIDDPDKLESMKMDIEDVIEEKKKPGPGCGPDGPPGVLVIHRKKGPKKQLKWKPDETLVEIEYFVLDETERVNVTKNFADARSSERIDERHNLQNRKLPSEDMMEEKMAWMALIPVDNVPTPPEGSQSREKKIQTERESRVLQSLYFSRSLVPDSAAEPDTEMHPKTDPIIIPLEDVTGNPDSVNDFTNMPWPEAKGMAPPSSQAQNNNYQTNSIFPDNNGVNGQVGFPNPYDNHQGNWVMDNQMPPNTMPPHGIPNPYGNPMMMNMMPPPNQQFTPQFQHMAGPPQGFPPQNMQPPPNMMPMPPMNMNMGPPIQMNHPPMVGNGGPGPMRGRGNDHEGGRGGWFRGGAGGGGWNRDRDGRGGGGGGGNRDWVRNNRDRNDRDRDHRERGVCRQYQNTGFCRMGDKCNYLHVNDNNRGHNRPRY